MAVATGTALLIAGLAGAGGTAAVGIHGANKASDSGDRAAKLATEGSARALEYTKAKDAQERADALAAQKANYEQWSAREQRMKPYRAAGQGANQTIAHLLGLPAVDIPDPAPPPAFLDAAAAAPSNSGANLPAGGIQPIGGPAPSSNVTGSPELNTIGPLTAPRMVTMKSPSGLTKQVPASQVAYYQQLGAEVVS